MASNQTAPTVCAGTIQAGPDEPRAPHGSHVWPCVLAPGHGEPCQPSAEALDYAEPFSARSEAWVRAELALYHQQLRTVRREHQQERRRDAEQWRDLTRLLLATARHGGGRSAKHGPLCWLRHPYCLAMMATTSSWRIRDELQTARDTGLTID